MPPRCITVIKSWLAKWLNEQNKRSCHHVLFSCMFVLRGLSDCFVLYQRQEQAEFFFFKLVKIATVIRVKIVGWNLTDHVTLSEFLSFCIYLKGVGKIGNIMLSTLSRILNIWTKFQEKLVFSSNVRNFKLCTIFSVSVFNFSASKDWKISMVVGKRRKFGNVRNFSQKMSGKSRPNFFGHPWTCTLKKFETRHVLQNKMEAIVEPLCLPHQSRRNVFHHLLS